jgi:hypothetical protein
MLRQETERGEACRVRAWKRLLHVGPTDGNSAGQTKWLREIITKENRKIKERNR